MNIYECERLAKQLGYNSTTFTAEFPVGDSGVHLKEDIMKKSKKDKMSAGYQLEGLDRTHTMLVMLQELLGVSDDSSYQHPAIWNKKCNKHLKKATEHLAALYQAIGEWEHEGK